MRFRFSLFVFLSLFFAAASVRAEEPGSSLHRGKDAAEIAASLDDRALAAQVLLTGIDGKAALPEAVRVFLRNIPAGGIMLFKYNLDTPKDGVKGFVSGAVSAVTEENGIPPFIAVDHEGGLVHRFGPGVEKLPSAFSFWELAGKEGRGAALLRAETLYRLSAAELRELGITMVLGPVAETLDEDNRLFLETRSYGPDPAFTEAAARVFIKSMDGEGIACAVKHFPGNSASDPHNGISTLRAGKSALTRMVKPFAGIIRCARPPMVMVSHALVPALDENKNASLSRAVIEGWLRSGLGFDGIVLADDFSMAAVRASGISPGAAAVEALNAGVDMIMTWPSTIGAIHASILDALAESRLSRERLQKAAERIIAAKIRYGLVAGRLVSPGAFVPGEGETP